MNLLDTIKKLVFVLFVSIQATLCSGTHLRGGHITVKQTSGLSCIVTVKAYTNSLSPILFSSAGGGILDFGDGTINNPPEQVSTPVYTAIGYVAYSIVHTYSSPGQYVVSYMEHDLDGGILTLFDSFTTPLYMETGITIVQGGNFYSGDFPAMPIFSFPLRGPFTFSSAALDTLHGYSYELVLPPLAQAYQAPTTLSINSHSGLMSWDTWFLNQFAAGKFYFAVKVTQYDNKGRQSGWIVRTFELILVDSPSRITINQPISDPNGRVVIPQGQQSTIKLILSDTTAADSLHWDLYVDASLVANVQLNQYDSTIVNRKMKIALLKFNSTTAIARDLPYLVSLRGTTYSQYLLTSKDINYCFFTRDVPFPAEVIAGISADREKPMQLYPNPFANNISVDGPDNVVIVITLINSLGETIWQAQATTGQPLDTSRVPVGLYMAQMSNGNSTVRKMVIRK